MQEQGLYNSINEHDACGVGFIADIKGVKSHAIVNSGLQILKNLTHRGAVGADPLQGDGAGILLQIPDELYRDDLQATYNITLPPPGEYGVGMIFLPQEEASRHACQEEIERAIAAEGQILLGWRDVPVDHDMPMSQAVAEKEPVIRQVFVGHSPDILVTDAFERKLYIIRKRSSIAIRALSLQHCKEFYIPSFSARTVVYKGQLLASQVGIYYKDLADSRCASALAVIHQRFSTNTFPQWSLAHPFRMIAHNGEINTLRGNFNWIAARQKHISSPLFDKDLKKLWPLIFKGQSDSASFDNAFELLTMSGYSLAQAAMLMIPEAWERNELMDNKLKAFYEYHAAMMEPWDGPAAIVFTDGRQLGAALDRNGLRPARYMLTDDNKLILASESGTLPIDEKHVVKKWRLEPGRMLLLDLEQGRIIDDKEIKTTLSTLRPYQEWVDRLRIRLEDLHEEPKAAEYKLTLPERLKVFGYSREDIERIVKPMAANGAEAIMSMGNDAPLAVLSQRPRIIYDYFRQLFAQVTNPPIDPIREKLVTSLVSFIGPRPNLLDIMASNPPVRLEVEQPILTPTELEKIRRIADYTNQKFRSRELDITYPISWGPDGIEARLASLKAAATDAIKSGVNILIVTDRNVSRERVAIPALLAVSAIHQSLVENGLRTSTGLVVETGSARSVHHCALLAGYGAEAICPYAALEAAAALAPEPKLAAKYQENYIHALDKGLNKIMAKMGICTYMSYIGAQIFEAVGLSSDFVERYFTNTPSPIEGIGLFDLAREAVAMHNAAFAPSTAPQTLLPSGGDLNLREDGEEHMWTADAVVHLQRAVRENNYNEFKLYSDIINNRQTRLMTLRGLLSFKPGKAVPIDEVESVESIVKRFSTAAMSLGSISAEAHCTMAVAMNRLGGMSNSGEGGEDPKRCEPIRKDCTLIDILGENAVLPLPLKKGDSLRSRIRQVASGRFGVNAQYLSAADVIQIKMAQGAKPGEGGQLPGDKVSPYIGYLRHSLPGIGLISPPPHHDIYSIEDLAQLIYDLKLVNPKALVSVKLVAQNGVGTVAAGVAKCKADHIVISGHDGGTGAAPINSVKNTGSAWEIGLADVQQTLTLNRLRTRVRVQVDGQLKTGRDVVIGAILGADEFGFGTAPLVSMGCLLMRKCQKNTCPAGIATQDPVLRKHFIGRPEHVMNFFYFIASEVREIMAQLGVRHFDDLIGHTEYLKQEDLSHFIKVQHLSLQKVLFKEVSDEKSYACTTQDHELDKCFDASYQAEVKKALSENKPLTIEAPVHNINRSVGTMLSGMLAASGKDLPEDFVSLKLRGTAGQSLGAFLMQGMSLTLEGEANDYVGKGLSGGIIAVHKDRDFKGEAADNIIAGNTCLYGAISGRAFFSGVVGERFAVRNSGASAVCEGAGDHGCEYMTGGTAVVLGRIGRNFAAGMSGGMAYIYDPDNTVRERLAEGSFIVSNVKPEKEQDSSVPLHLGRSDEQVLRELISEHVKRTGSERGAFILEHFESELTRFVKIFPQEYFKALAKLAGREA
ncbi:MAG: glutamate synthase subunit alpha [Proteobacteria bacterium]|uniref:Glutamate synthase [NADPH] large chain n=1 Tax=Candidatus Avisuccinivibrio stercorigallinarum TaxID=2840704 RepID=A0A9D9D8M0_9GAMM|nr:glutamate synthase subunit alpha [Candidatus Avisuccinivibrio stercorigallinarum]